MRDSRLAARTTSDDCAVCAAADRRCSDVVSPLEAAPKCHTWLNVVCVLAAHRVRTATDLLALSNVASEHGRRGSGSNNSSEGKAHHAWHFGPRRKTKRSGFELKALAQSGSIVPFLGLKHDQIYCFPVQALRYSRHALSKHSRTASASWSQGRNEYAFAGSLSQLEQAHSHIDSLAFTRSLTTNGCTATRLIVRKLTQCSVPRVPA